MALAPDDAKMRILGCQEVMSKRIQHESCLISIKVAPARSLRRESAVPPNIWKVKP